jgi:hypothetical protein
MCLYHILYNYGVKHCITWCQMVSCESRNTKTIKKAALIPIRLRLQLIKAYIPTYNCNHTYNRKSSTSGSFWVKQSGTFGL